MSVNRRQFIKASGAVVVCFSLDACDSSSEPDTEATASFDSRITINPDGSVELFLGKVELGQGISTALAQIAAQELGVAFAQIHLVTVDTDFLLMSLTPLAVFRYRKAVRKFVKRPPGHVSTWVNGPAIHHTNARKLLANRSNASTFPARFSVMNVLFRTFASTTWCMRACCGRLLKGRSYRASMLKT